MVSVNISHTSSLPLRRIPLRVFGLSFAGLMIPVLVPLRYPGLDPAFRVVLWLLALVPAFLLAYYRGWRGAAVALVSGMGMLALGQLAASLLGYPVGMDPWLQIVIVNYVGVVLGIGWVSELLHRDRALIEQLALTDELTQLANRRFARLFLESELAAARRGRSLVVVLFDLDHFKAYNDRHGHAAGDEALRTFARVLKGETRRMNLSSRHGGEEFLSVLSSSNLEGAMVFVDRVRFRLAENQPEAGPLRFSAGVAEFRPEMTSPKELLAAADRALYQAKQDGRNCVRVFGQSHETAQAARVGFPGV